MTEMELFELIVRSSIQIIQVDNETKEPTEFGSGCFVNYLDRMFLLSVSHVTNREGLTTFLESGHHPVNNQSFLYPVAGLNYFREYKLSGELDAESFTELLENGGNEMDITFTELLKPVIPLQFTTDLGFYKVEKGEKVYLNLDTAVDPHADELYGFYGNINVHYTGKYLQRTPTLIHSLRFHRTKACFHIFLAPQPITDPDRYRGCSGAPILDSEGRLVALASHVGVNSNMILGFSILECKRLIDQWLAIEAISRSESK